MSEILTNTMNSRKNFVYNLYHFGHIMYKAKIPLLPLVMKLLIRILFYAAIDPKTEIGKNILFGNNGLGIAIHPNTVIGDNVTITHHVTIGGSKDGEGVPVIGNNVYIGAGARLFGDIKIGNNAKIGANAVVLIDVPENATAVGVPARIIKCYRK